MKKRENKAMRLASVLLVLTLLATSMTAGTFAKYTTEKNVETTARVAKFGVDISVDTANLFGDKYDATGVTTGADGVTVKADTEKTKVVAPGTTGFMTFSVTGTPETDVTVAIEIANTDNKRVMLAAGEYKNGEEAVNVPENGYYPVKWTLKQDDKAVTEIEGNTLADINAYFQGNDFTKSYSAGTNLNSIKYTLSWEWEYEKADVTNDGADTILGDLAAADKDDITKGDQPQELTEGTDYNLNEAFTFNIKVTQAD